MREFEDLFRPIKPKLKTPVLINSNSLGENPSRIGVKECGVIRTSDEPKRLFIKQGF